LSRNTFPISRCENKFSTLIAQFRLNGLKDFPSQIYLTFAISQEIYFLVAQKVGARYELTSVLVKKI
ncbi:hypothetical protein, partial [Fischerella thermalis]|uniref:hypothetical protein n=1 Tax=Fischerella thermalis TaxID=372787 RepID=UPI001C68FABF